MLPESDLRLINSLHDMSSETVDFGTATDADIKNLIKSVNFEVAPQSNLVLKTSIIKREAGVFSQFKEATAVLTRDK